MHAHAGLNLSLDMASSGKKLSRETATGMSARAAFLKWSGRSTSPKQLAPNEAPSHCWSFCTSLRFQKPLSSRPLFTDLWTARDGEEATSYDAYLLKKEIPVLIPPERKMSEKALVFVYICHLKKEPISET